MSVHDRPTSLELIDAVRAYLLDEVVPAASDRRASFRARIAANVLAIVARELVRADEDEAGEAAGLRALGFAQPDLEAGRRELSRRIRRGDYDDPAQNAALIAYAFAHVRAKLRVANPAYR